MARRISSMAEEDAFTRWRHVLAYVQRAGVRSAVKRRARQRERRDGKKEARCGQRLDGD
jgi:hypothetical protein